MKHVLFWLVILGLVLAALRAMAGDRDGRAKAVFEDRCASCHVVGWGAPYKELKKSLVDLTAVAKKRDLERLRKWIADPIAQKSDTLCRAGGLDTVQVDLLVAFLHTRAKTISRKLVVPPKRTVERQP